jgi:hypothetical protein
MSKHEYLFLKDRVTGLKRVKIAASSSGNNTLVAAVTGKKLRVYLALVAQTLLDCLRLQPTLGSHLAGVLLDTLKQTKPHYLI